MAASRFFYFFCIFSFIFNSGVVSCAMPLTGVGYKLGHFYRHYHHHCFHFLLHLFMEEAAKQDLEERLKRKKRIMEKG